MSVPERPGPVVGQGDADAGDGGGGLTDTGVCDRLNLSRFGLGIILIRARSVASSGGTGFADRINGILASKAAEIGRRY